MKRGTACTDAAAPVPVLSRLLAVTPSTAVRVTPKGLKAAADVDGLLNFLDETVTAFTDYGIECLKQTIADERAAGRALRRTPSTE